MSYVDALFLFFLGYVVHSELVNKSAILERVFPDAAGWASIIYAIRVMSIFQIAFATVVNWNFSLLTVASLALLMTFRGYTGVPKSFNEQELLHNLKTQALSAIIVYGGFIALSLLR